MYHEGPRCPRCYYVEQLQGSEKVRPHMFVTAEGERTEYICRETSPEEMRYLERQRQQNFVQSLLR